jgi:hypothetical protein
VDNWTKELDGSVKEFVRQAGEVREWDKVLVRTGSQVSWQDLVSRSGHQLIDRSRTFTAKSLKHNRVSQRQTRRLTISTTSRKSSRPLSRTTRVRSPALLATVTGPCPGESQQTGNERRCQSAVQRLRVEADNTGTLWPKT